MYKGQVYKVKGQGQVLWLKTAIIISWIFHYFCKKTTGSHGLQVTTSLICISVILNSAAISWFFRHLFTLQNSLIKSQTRILEKETPSTLSGYLLSKSTRLINHQLLNFGLTHRPHRKKTSLLAATQKSSLPCHPRGITSNAESRRRVCLRKMDLRVPKTGTFNIRTKSKVAEYADI